MAHSLTPSHTHTHTVQYVLLWHIHVGNTLRLLCPRTVNTNQFRLLQDNSQNQIQHPGVALVKLPAARYRIVDIVQYVYRGYTINIIFGLPTSTDLVYNQTRVQSIYLRSDSELSDNHCGMVEFARARTNYMSLLFW